MNKHDLAPPSERWTHIEEYLVGLARRRTLRRSRLPMQRTQPEAPSVMLSTLPFAALICVLGLLVVVFAVAAWPASEAPSASRPAAESERGTAAPGWFDEAKKEMR